MHRFKRQREFTIGLEGSSEKGKEKLIAVLYNIILPRPKLPTL